MCFRPLYRDRRGKFVTSTRKLRRMMVVLSVALLLLAAGAVPGLAPALRIGGLVSMTGDLGAFWKPFYDSAMLAISQINEQGGVLGERTLELVLADTQTNPVQGLAAAQR